MLSNAPAAAGEVEKLTKQIRIGSPFMVSERLHYNLVRISQMIGNAPMVNALRMAALEGSERILQKFTKSTTTIIDERIQIKLIGAVCEYEEQIIACALANDCDEVQALGILLGIGARHGSVNGWSAPEEKALAAKKSA